MQHKPFTPAIFATTLSLFVLVSSCEKSQPTASSQDSPESPVATEVKADTVESTETEPAQTEPANAEEETEKFFGLLESSLDQEEKAIHAAVGQEKVLQLAQSTCQEFKSGKSFDAIATDVVSGLESAGLEGEQLDEVAYYSGKVMGAGVTAFCPEYQEQIQQDDQSESGESAQAESSDQKTEQFFAILESALSDEEKAIHQQIGDEDALNLAQAACQDFEQGKSFEAITNDVVGGLQEAGLQGDELQKTAYYSGKVIGVGVAVFCPQYRSQIEG